MIEPNTQTVEPTEAVEAASAAKLVPFWRQAECGDPHYPVFTKTVEHMLGQNDYLADRGLINELAETVIPVERDDEGVLRWSATNVFHLVMQLEGRRRWRPFSPLHAFKANNVERMQWEAEECGVATFVTDLDKWDVESLLCVMEEADLPSIRQLMRVAILTKLQQQGAL